MTSRSVSAATMALVGLLLPAAAGARDLAPTAYAARTGISFNPDQFGAGLHFRVGDRMKPQIRPALDVGVGNGVRLVALSGDLIYEFGRGVWSPYAGGGPGVNFFDVTDGVGEKDGLQAKFVGHAVTGLLWSPRRGRYAYFVEGRFGVGDTPRVRINVGMAF